jgi:hypothetical protein
MLKSYEAIYDHGKIEWLSDVPDVEQARVIITLLPQASGANVGQIPSSANEKAADDLLADSFGAWGKRSVVEVTATIEAQRSQDWGDN